MSASASKKRRQQQNENGLTFSEQAAAKAKKEKKRKTVPIVVFCIVCLIAVGLVIGLAVLSAKQKERLLDEQYADTVGASTTVIATVGDETITAAVYNYFYVTADKPEDLESFHHTLGETLNLYAAAKQSGFTLSDEDNAWIDEQIESVREAARSQGQHIKADYLLTNYYGIGCNEANFRQYLTITRTVTSFQTKISEEYATDEMIEAEYAEHPENYDVVSYDVYTPTVEEGDDDAALKAKADDAEKTFPEDDADDQSGNITNVTTSYGEEIASWLFDSARKDGDVKAFADTSAETTVYRVVRFNLRDTNDYFPVTADLAYFPMSTATTDTEEASETETESVEDKIIGVVAAASENPELSTEDFTSLVSEAGGYYFGQTPIYKYAFGKDITNYLYSDARAAGDTQYFAMEGAYYLLRYQSVGEETYRITQVKNSIVTEYLEELGHANEIQIDESAYEKTCVDPAVYAPSDADTVG